MADNDKKGAAGTIHRLSQLGRRRAGTEDTPASSDEALIASIYMPDGGAVAPERPAPPVEEDPPYATGHDPEVPPGAEVPEPPARGEERPSAAEAVPAHEGAGAEVKRPSKKVMAVAIAVLIVTAVSFARSCSTAPEKKTAETKAAETHAPWIRVESNEVKPLAVMPDPSAAVGVDREKQIPKLLESLNKPEPPVAPVVPADKPDAPKAEDTARARELEAKVAALTQELQAVRLENEKAKNPASGPARRQTPPAKPPAVKIMAIVRTEKCQSCPLLALLDVDGATLQVVSGDKVKDYTVMVSTDRVVLTRDKKHLTFYSVAAP